MWTSVSGREFECVGFISTPHPPPPTNTFITWCLSIATMLNLRNTVIVLYAGFDVITAVVVNSSIFSHATPCSPMKVNLRF
jgi:multisubunit Na+/H+ antiporter MnhB subunit